MATNMPFALPILPRLFMRLSVLERFCRDICRDWLNPVCRSSSEAPLGPAACRMAMMSMGNVRPPRRRPAGRRHRTHRPRIGIACDELGDVLIFLLHGAGDFAELLELPLPAID